MQNLSGLIKALAEQDYRVPLNVAPEAVGHVVGEMDNFARARLLGEVPSRAAVFCADHGDRLAVLRDLFGDAIAEEWFLGDYAGYVGSVIGHVAPNLVVDVGFSATKLAPPAVMGRSGACEWDPATQRYRDQAGQWVLAGIADWYRRRSLTVDSSPFLNRLEFSPLIERLIGARGGPVAVVAAAPYPARYLAAFALLKDHGYTLVLGGRGRLPDEWRHFGVVDYAGSVLASFDNDFRLALRADLGVTQACGFSVFFEVLDKPYVCLDLQITATPPFSRRAVYTPAIFRHRADGRLLPFTEQHDAFTTGLAESQVAIIPASADQVAAATLEALQRAQTPDQPRTELQSRYQGIASSDIFGYARSVVCDAFLRDWEALLEPTQGILPERVEPAPG